MKRSLLSLSLLLILGLTGLQAQLNSGVFFQDRQSEATLIRYGTASPSQAITDHYLRTIALSKGKAAQKAQMILVHDEVLQLARIDQYTLQVYAAIENFQIEGDHDYLGFDLSSYLKPSAVQFKLRLRNGLNKVKDTWNFDGVAMQGEPAVIANFRETDSTNFRLDKLELIDKAFVYNEGSRNLFDSQVQLIQEYYAATDELDGLFRQLEAVNTADFEHLQEQENRLHQVSDRLQQIDAQRYPERLGLNPSLDPARFLSGMAEITAMIREKEALLQQTVDQLPFLIHQRGLSFLQQGKRDLARRDFNYALEVAPGFPPALLELARMELNDGVRANAMPRLMAILNNPTADPAVRGEAVNMLQSLQNQDLTLVRQDIASGDFGTALNQLEALAAYCGSVPELNCAQTLQPEYEKAHQGIYRRLLQQARQALDRQQPDQAEAKAREAMDYQQAQSAFVPNNQDAVRMLDQAHRTQYRMALSAANAALEAGQLDEAENQIDRAMQLASDFPRAIAQPQEGQQLLVRIKKARSQALIAQGRDQLNAGRAEDALDRFESAREMEQEFGLQADASLPGLAREAARRVTLNLVGKAMQEAQTNQLPQARATTGEATQLSGTYALMDDPDVAQGMDQLQKAIFDQECINAQNEFLALLESARNQRKALVYTEAETIYQQALDFAREKSVCQLDLTEAQQELREVAPAAQYQRDLAEASQQVSRALYRDAVQTYEDAGEAYASHQLQTLGLEHRSTLDFFLLENRNEFTLYGIGLFTDRGEYGAALQLSRQIALMGYPKSRYKAVQLQLGRELAFQDHEANPTGNPKALALQHTKGSKLLKFVYKGYVKHWKQL